MLRSLGAPEKVYCAITNGAAAMFSVERGSRTGALNPARGR